MRITAAVIVAIGLSLVVSQVFLPAQPNPFFDAPAQRRQDHGEEPAEMQRAPARRPSFAGALRAGPLGGFVRRVAAFQRDLKRELAAFMRSVSQAGLSVAGWLAVLGL